MTSRLPNKKYFTVVAICSNAFQQLFDFIEKITRFINIDIINIIIIIMHLRSVPERTSSPPPELEEQTISFDPLLQYGTFAWKILPRHLLLISIQKLFPMVYALYFARALMYHHFSQYG